MRSTKAGQSGYAWNATTGFATDPGRLHQNGPPGEAHPPSLGVPGKQGPETTKVSPDMSDGTRAVPVPSRLRPPRGGPMSDQIEI